MATPKKLIVKSVDLNDMSSTEMATFVLEGNEVKATYKNEGFKHEMRRGIPSFEGMVGLEDGPKFMEALSKAYSRCSTIVVEPG
jgi:hypothetical protein